MRLQSKSRGGGRPMGDRQARQIVEDGPGRVVFSAIKGLTERGPLFVEFEGETFKVQRVGKGHGQDTTR